MMPARLGTALRILAILVFVSAAVFGGHAFAQDLTIAPKLLAGDVFRLEITRTRDNPSQPQQNGRSTTLVDVHVASASADGIILDWIPGKTILPDRQQENPLLRAAATLLDGLTLRLGLTADGEFDALLNEREVAARLQPVVDLMVEGAVASMPPEDRKPFQAFISQLLSPALLIGAATVDAKTYFSQNGVTLAVGETIEADLEQPNPLGGGTLPARFRITCESATAESAMFVTSTTYDKSAFTQIARSLAEKSGKPLPPEELAKIPPIEMKDEGRFVLDRATGLMREAAVKRRISAGAMQRVDGWEMRLVQPPKR
jgi:hypothetical protein